MSMNYKDAKAWAKVDSKNRDWRNEWKYGTKLRAVGLGDEIIFVWGRSITDPEKELISLLIGSPSKWARKAERIFDALATRTIESGLLTNLRELKRLKD